jgi:hypothetical protein
LQACNEPLSGRATPPGRLQGVLEFGELLISKTSTGLY